MGHGPFCLNIGSKPVKRLDH
ncbi:unnamed protein product [Spirodela intermedia]|uniref:Uncharacterized protein n=1 Tax=Spirodela intermedia TaxID=51605 RepID=A0A7I8KJJ6_SPIIN|nr:unnamed protein product [Spirodela intermedia]